MVQDDEKFYRLGLAALAARDASVAVKHFSTALKLQVRNKGTATLRMRCVSYYGLTMVLAFGPSNNAIEVCERAARKAPFDPILQHNLAKVHILAGHTTRAIAALERGLRIDPNNRGMRAQLARLDRRGGLWFPRLHRDHPFNRWAGRFRHGGRARHP